MRPEAVATEVAWQALDVVDVGQTVTIARQPGAYYESSACLKDFAGRHPSERSVYAYMAAFAVVHLAVTAALDERDPGGGPWHYGSLAWQWATLGKKAGNVLNNRDVGVRLWGAHESSVPEAAR